MMRGQAGDRAEMGQGRGRVPAMSGRDAPCFRRGCIVDGKCNRSPALGRGLPRFQNDATNSAKTFAWAS